MFKNDIFLYFCICTVLLANFSLDFLPQSAMNFATQVSMLFTFSFFDPRFVYIIFHIFISMPLQLGENKRLS